MEHDLEQQLDQALAATFPASDPVALSRVTHVGCPDAEDPGNEGPKRPDDAS